MRLYICGKMRGLPQFGFPNFDAARDMLDELGVNTISPADLDRDEGFDPNGPLRNFDVKAAMRRDIAAIIRPDTDGICLIKGWQTSQGAAIERMVNNAVGGLEFEMIYDGDRLVGIESVAG